MLHQRYSVVADGDDALLVDDDVLPVVLLHLGIVGGPVAIRQALEFASGQRPGTHTPLPLVAAPCLSFDCEDMVILRRLALPK